MDLGISGKRAAVAAATSGLGLASARALAQAGVEVVICGRDQGRLDSALASLAAEGLTVHGVQADVSTGEGGRGFVEAATAILGGIDILVANAGGPPAGGFATTALDAYPAALEQSLLSTVAMCLAAAPAMREQRWGRVVAITSVSVRQPLDNLILSNTARAGVTGFLKTMALEIAADGVTVNSVQPGGHDTERIRALHGDAPGGSGPGLPMGVLGRPQDFGAVVAFLCSDQARYITGAAVPVDGGAYRGLQ